MPPSVLNCLKSGDTPQGDIAPDPGDRVELLPVAVSQEPTGEASSSIDAPHPRLLDLDHKSSKVQAGAPHGRSLAQHGHAPQ